MLQRHTLAGAGLVLCAHLVTAAPCVAQVVITSGAAEINLTGRVHTQFNSTSVDGERESEFIIRRARFTAEVQINDLVSGKVEPEYGEGSAELRDVYLRLTFSPSFRATFGQFKRPFDLFELTSSTRTLVIERAGSIRGVSPGCTPGADGVCSLSQLTERLGYSDRDIGVMVDGVNRDGRWGYMVSLTNGAGQNRIDENGMKSFSGRVRYTPREDLTIAANVGLHDYVNAIEGDEYAVAWGADVEVGNYEQGLHLQAGLITGGNWRNLVAGDPSSFLTLQGIVSYRVPVANNPFITAYEPVGRLSWGDPDTDVSDDDGVLFTPGIMVHFVGLNKIAANIDIWSPSQDDAEWSVKIQSYFYF